MIDPGDSIERSFREVTARSIEDDVDKQKLRKMCERALGGGKDECLEEDEPRIFRIEDTYLKIVGIFGFPEEFIRASLIKNECNYCTATYYFLQSDQDYSK